MLREKIRIASETDGEIRGKFCRETLGEEELSGLTFAGAEFSACRFVRCNFSGASFHKSAFSDCVFSGCSFREGWFRECSFSGCKGEGSDFFGAVFKACSLWASASGRARKRSRL